MFSELLLVGRPFLKLHRRWITIFFGFEIFILLAESLALRTVSQNWISEASRLSFLFLVPPFVLQMTLSLHLGLTFNLKSPGAWTLRLPVPKRAPSWFSNIIIWANALVLFVFLIPAWVLFFEMTAYPIAVVL